MKNNAQPTRQTHTGQAGFTIVEVMVAVIIFAVGLTAVAGMQTRSIEQSTFSDQMTDRVNAITHWAESLKRMPVMEEDLGIDGGITINVEVNPLFEENVMCEYGKTCDWDYIDYEEDNHPHRLRRKITQGYPLPNLVMIELEAAPRGVSEEIAERRTASVAYIRSTRWN
jgi:prepilin-type N-terminal cleavage/methylation domain-containing protein